MRRALLAAALALSLGAAATEADASLLGATVTGQLTGGTGASVGTQFAPASAVVGPGVEFQGSLFNAGFSQTFELALDLAATTITLSVTGPGVNVFTAAFQGVFGGVTLSGLPAGVTGIALQNYSCAQPPFSNCGSVFDTSTLATLDFANGTFSVTFAGLARGQTYVFAVQESPVNTVPVNTVPVPGALALLVPALLGLATVRRRAD